MHGVDVVRMHIFVVKQVFYKGLLRHVDGDMAIVLATAIKLDTQEKVNLLIEGDFGYVGGEAFHELFFNFGAL